MRTMELFAAQSFGGVSLLGEGRKRRKRRNGSVERRLLRRKKDKKLQEGDGKK